MSKIMLIMFFLFVTCGFGVVTILAVHIPPAPGAHVIQHPVRFVVLTSLGMGTLWTLYFLSQVVLVLPKDSGAQQKVS